METSNAAQVIIAIIPIVGIVMGSIVIFFYLLWNHRRKILSIKAGQYIKPEFNLLSFSLLSGLLLSSVGIALTILLSLVVREASYGLLGGIIPLSMGIGLLAFYIIKRRDKND
ncbi:MAG: hypothetical protein FWB86_02170 [Treponema sp.]|nr:hypothetical protein [Treponema sp.]MCL2250967.1 hypothetical protein [Treponema sp.]